MTEPLTPDEIADIRRRADAATASPSMTASMRGFAAASRAGALDRGDDEMVAVKFEEAATEIDRLLATIDAERAAKAQAIALYEDLLERHERYMHHTQAERDQALNYQLSSEATSVRLQKLIFTTREEKRLAVERADAERARAERLAEIVSEVVSEFGCSIEQFHRNGPDLTTKAGYQYFAVSTLLDREELIEKARAALADEPLPAPPTGGER